MPDTVWEYQDILGQSIKMFRGGSAVKVALQAQKMANTERRHISILKDGSRYLEIAPNRPAQS